MLSSLQLPHQIGINVPKMNIGKDVYKRQYLGIIEVTQDITDFRKLEGDQRLLSYSSKS